MKVVTWNVGSYYFLNYAVKRGKSFHGHPLRTIYFQPELNGDFISSNLQTFDADIIFLQEIMTVDETKYIEVLKQYPYKTLLPNVHHEHSILVAAKLPFETEKRGDVTLVHGGDITFVPVHFDAHSAKARHDDAEDVRAAIKGVERLIIIGDTNIWSRGKHCIFPADRSAYATLTQELTDITSELHSTSCFGLAFDKVMVSNDMKAADVRCVRVRSYFMDHYPVIAEIQSQ